ncbi:MAG: carboxypeptidase regulatory-like domain-containing protein, partial [Sphingomonadales bacterium]
MRSTPCNRSPLSRRLAAALAFGSATSALALALAVPAHAQESTASLRGTITADSQVTQVVAVDASTGTRRTATVSSSGNYAFSGLRPGTYRLELTTANGVRNTDEFTLQVAQNAVLDFD